MIPFVSGVPHFMTRVHAYTVKVLPLVFDNSLSYYEFLGHVVHKLNQCIDALNSQNLIITEFCHMVELELKNYETYMTERQNEFETNMKNDWNDFKTALQSEWAEFKQQLLDEWEKEKALNEKFRTDLLQEFTDFKSDVLSQIETWENNLLDKWETYKSTVNAEISQFENTVNADLSSFKSTMQTQQNEFESHMTQLFTDFTTDEQQARTAFESNFQQLFETWKVNTLQALNSSISQWETETTERLTATFTAQINAFENTVNNQLSDISRAIVLEKDTREKAVKDLQAQIDDFVKSEGTIKLENVVYRANAFISSALESRPVRIFQNANYTDLEMLQLITSMQLTDDSLYILFTDKRLLANIEKFELTNHFPSISQSFNLSLYAYPDIDSNIDISKATLITSVDFEYGESSQFVTVENTLKNTDDLLLVSCSKGTQFNYGIVQAFAKQVNTAYLKDTVSGVEFSVNTYNTLQTIYYNITDFTAVQNEDFHLTLQTDISSSLLSRAVINVFAVADNNGYAYNIAYTNGVNYAAYVSDNKIDLEIIIKGTPSFITGKIYTSISVF